MDVWWMCREWNAVCGTRGLVGGAGVGCVIESRRIQFDARYTGCDYCIVLSSSSSSSSLVSARTGSSRRMVDWLVEGAAVATALGARRSSSSSGPIGYDRDACNGKKKTAPEMSLGKVGWQVGSRVARPACCCSGSTGAAGASGPSGVPCGLSDVHACIDSVSALGNGATLTTGSPS